MEPGDLFEEKYRVVGQLGTGGQSNVYRADEIATGRRVAIKLLHDHGDGVRFIREGRVVSRLSSPHTVRLIEFDRASTGRFYMVFEFIAGDNLAQVARSEAPLEWPRVAKLARQVLEALAEAHELGIVHRDIKPSNIMVAPGGEAKVLDFGVARLDEGDGKSLTETGEVLGTPRYVSPESLAGEPVTAAADVYAVGLVAWELLVGRPANDARNGADIVLRHLDPTPYRLPTDIELSDAARRWVTSMCNKNAARRPQDAAEALLDLNAFEEAPLPLVVSDDEEYDPDIEESHTGVLGSFDSEPEESEPNDTAIDSDIPADIDAPIVDPTEPDPWRPDEMIAAAASMPPAAAPAEAPEAAEVEDDAEDPSAPAPPQQPRSTGIPQNNPLRAIRSKPDPPAQERPPMGIIALIVLGLFVATVTLLWLATR